jgi:hypothetical protein
MFDVDDGGVTDQYVRRTLRVGGESRSEATTTRRVSRGVGTWVISLLDLASIVLLAL